MIFRSEGVVGTMARNYAAIPYDYLEEMADLNDAEFGRLVRAVLVYSSTGETVALSGNERFLYRRAIMQEQRFRESYDEIAARNQKNGAKGGRPKKQDKPIETGENPEEPSTPQKTETETETKTDTLPSNEGKSTAEGETEFAGMSPALANKIRQWLQYKKERRETYKPTGRNALITRIRTSAAKYGDAAVIAVIDASMSANYAGIVFDRLPQQAARNVKMPGGARGENRPLGGLELQAIQRMMSKEDVP